MNVLLPISNCAECRKVRYELSATNGCYTWQNSHPQLVLMTDAYGSSLGSGSSGQGPGDCQNSVFLEAKTLKETKSIILITAKDINSGTVLKCSAKVGQVDRLEITTRSRQFNVKNDQQLEVMGYDDEENVFSSMDGFSFDWKIIEGTDIIKKFAPLDTGTRHLHHTDFFFVRSLKAGFATVSVKLEEPGYENVKSAQKRLTVVDPFIILPSEPVYILPTSEFKFSIAHLDMGWFQNIHRNIKIPDPQYKWSTQNSTIGTIRDDGKFRSKLIEGEAEIFVIDQEMKNNTAEGYINVVYPYRIEVSVRDITNLEQLRKLHEGDDVEFIQAWSEGLDKIDSEAEQKQEQGDTYILIEEHYYRIQIFLYDKDGHMITLTENLRFKTHNLNAKWIEIIKVNKIGSEMVIKTKKIDKDKIQINSQYKLDEIIPVPQDAQKYTDFASRLTQDKELIITRPVRIQHPTSLVLLPFLPEGHEAHGTGEIWNLGSRGGSGTYQWSIVDTSIATVKGSAQIKSIAIGKTQLICRDYQNRNNWDAIEVEVALIHQFKWVEDQVEIKAKAQLPFNHKEDDKQQKKPPLGEYRVLSLIALDSKARKFTNCTSVRPSYELRGETFVTLTDDAQTTNKYGQIKDYINTAANYDLLQIRQQFDEQPNAMQRTELSGDGVPKLSELLMKHNNFGICAQRVVHGETEGLARLRASFIVYDYLNGPSHLLESEHAEIAVYNPLTSLAPTYKPYMSDMYSYSQLGQEFQSFETFYEDWKFKLQFGASLNWRVVGGSNFWPDQAENYQTHWKSEIIKGNAGKNAFYMKTLSILTSESQFEVICNTPEDLTQSQRVKINLQQTSRSTRQLLMPAVHETKIELHCEPPKHLKLLWSQDYRPSLNDTMRVLQSLPRSRIVHNERTHFVLVNSRHSIRYLVLDDLNQVSFNSSSLLTSVTASDDSMATIQKLLVANEDSKAMRSYRDDSLSGIYDKRSVQFKNITGRLYLKAHTTHYLEDFNRYDGDGTKKNGGSIWGFGGSKSSKASDVTKGVYQSTINGDAHVLENAVSDSMIIEVVRNVDVEPKFKSLYIGTHQQTYKLRILHGSGAFSVTVNNTRLVDIVQKDREILLTPKELGGLKIMVEDLELPQSEIATAQLLISDIAKLTLWAPQTLIEQGDELTLTVSAYDSFMNMFDADQYALMRFSIETETMGLRRTGGLQSTQKANEVREFIANGRDSGVYQLTAFTFAFVHAANTHAKAGKIVSEMLRIEVFPLLEIYPSNLLIAPNMRYTLQIMGGPQTTVKSQQIDGSHIEINFAIQNTKVATIDRFREVTGHEVGDAVLKYEIIQLRTQNHVKPMEGGHELTGQGILATTQPQSRVVSKKTVKIRVRLVTSIEIPFTHQRQIYSGSLIKMIAVLKHDEELFHHGIGPISYSWSVSESRVLGLDIPTKQELASVHGVASNLVMTSRYIRDNVANRELNFFTSFNSSSVYANGDQEGETSVKCQLAIEYPVKYKHEKNWFTVTVNVMVTDRLAIQVPQYSQYSAQSERETHLYLVPPKTLTRIETNKQTKLKLGYSQQSVFDYSINSYRYEESATPIIELVNDEAIRTFDKYGKVTLFVEEGGAFSDQMVMLNVKVADVFTIASMRSYDALSLPLGSSVQLPLHLQDDRAHKFAEKISGVSIGFHLSHPKVVHVSLNQYNETMTVHSLGSGDCNIFLYLEDRPHIFDVIRVRVSGIVQPASPVYIHIGGEINFRVESTENLGQESTEKNIVWSSSNLNVLQVDSNSGKARAMREGKADVLLSNHSNAASIVHVSKITDAQLDQKSQLIIRTDDTNQSFYSGSQMPEYRVRIRLFLDHQSDETMPTVQFDGITLIRNNINIACQSDNPNYVNARGEVNDLEGFFCVMNYIKDADIRAMPKFVKIAASVSAKDPQTSKIAYKEQIIEFEMQLQSEITVETRFQKEVKLCRDHRTETIRVYSSSDFKVNFDYGYPQDDAGQLVLHQVSHLTVNGVNEYKLSVQVPIQVSHSFDATMILSHQFAQKEKKIKLNFEADKDCGSTASQSILSQAGGYFGSSAQEAPIQQQQNQPQDPITDSQSASWISYIIFFVAVVLVVIFILSHICDVDILYVWDHVFGKGKRVSQTNQRHYNQQYQRFQTNLSNSGDGIREARASRRQVLARDSFNSSQFQDQSGLSMSAKNRQNLQNQGRGQQRLHFDDVNIRRNQQNQMSSSRQSQTRFDSIHNSAQYY